MIGPRPVCDHCGNELDIQYRPDAPIGYRFRFVHAETWLGRWSCPGGNGTLATWQGAEVLDVHPE